VTQFSPFQTLKDNGKHSNFTQHKQGALQKKMPIHVITQSTTLLQELPSLLYTSFSFYTHTYVSIYTHIIYINSLRQSVSQFVFILF